MARGSQIVYETERTHRVFSLGMTPARQRVLDEVADWVRNLGMSPSITQLSDSLGLAVSTVWAHLKGLELSGHIRRDRQVGCNQFAIDVVSIEGGLVDRLCGAILEHSGLGIPSKELRAAIESAGLRLVVV